MGKLAWENFVLLAVCWYRNGVVVIEDVISESSGCSEIVIFLSASAEQLGLSRAKNREKMRGYLKSEMTTECCGYSVDQTAPVEGEIVLVLQVKKIFLKLCGREKN